jgi:hypothetical protein
MRRLATLIIESVTITVWESRRRFESVEEGGVELNQGWAVSDGTPEASRIYSSAKVLSVASVTQRTVWDEQERTSVIIPRKPNLPPGLGLSLLGISGLRALTLMIWGKQSMYSPHRGNVTATRRPRPIAGL